MVRINLINPRKLSDQHLIAEYDEILMLRGYVIRYPQLTEKIPTFRLGKGHILFFKDKLVYLQKRHELLKAEMKRRGFHPQKTFLWQGIPRTLLNDWRPTAKDLKLIKTRLRERIRAKPGFYRYYRTGKDLSFFLRLLR